MEETKPFKISKQIVKVAFDRVKANKGPYGIECHLEHTFQNQ